MALENSCERSLGNLTSQWLIQLNVLFDSFEWPLIIIIIAKDNSRRGMQALQMKNGRPFRIPHADFLGLIVGCGTLPEGRICRCYYRFHPGGLKPIRR